MSLPEFIFLPDIVLLEIFSYLSCEDALYAFDSLNNRRLSHLLEERGAFRQICLSPEVSRALARYLALRPRPLARMQTDVLRLHRSIDAVSRISFAG